jgi:uncharacterized protein YdeI (BOF family)
LLQLRNENEVFTSTDTEVSFRTGQGVADRRIGLQHRSMDAVIFGNFGTDTIEVQLDFPNTGTWHDFFPGESIEITQADTTAIYAPGEFHVYTSEPTFTPARDIVPFGRTNFRQPPRRIGIRAARSVDVGTRVEITGTVTRRASRVVYIEDSGGGITVRSANVAREVQPGSRITLTGEISLADGRPTLDAIERFSIDDNVGTPTPELTSLRSIRENPDQFDSRLVQVSDLFIRRSGASTFEANRSYPITDGRNDARLQVGNESGLVGESIPEGTATFRGVVTASNETITLQGLADDDIQADDPAAFRFTVNPNPVSTRARVNLFLPENGNLSIELFDALGRKVRSIVPEGAARAAQIYKFDIDASTLSSGVYFLRLRYEVPLEDAQTVTKKIVVVK